MFLQILAVIAEFEANLIRQCTREGMDIAQIAGLFSVSRPTVYRSLQRTTALPPLPGDSRPVPDVARYDQLLIRQRTREGMDIAQIAGLFSVSRPIVYRSLQRTTALPPLPGDSRPALDVARYDQLLTRTPGTETREP